MNTSVGAIDYREIDVANPKRWLVELRHAVSRKIGPEI
jgi:hypothetical protein